MRFVRTWAHGGMTEPEPWCCRYWSLVLCCLCCLCCYPCFCSSCCCWSCCRRSCCYDCRVPLAAAASASGREEDAQGVDCGDDRSLSLSWLDTHVCPAWTASCHRRTHWLPSPHASHRGQGTPMSTVRTATDGTRCPANISMLTAIPCGVQLHAVALESKLGPTP